MATANKLCATCKHFRKFQKPTTIDDGECRRFPPAFTPFNQGDGSWIERFPKVSMTAWCGEWKSTMECER